MENKQTDSRNSPKQPTKSPSRSATKQCENNMAHGQAGAVYCAKTGETFVVYRHEKYSFEDFDKLFPNRGYIGSPSNKGKNSDTTKDWMLDND